MKKDPALLHQNQLHILYIAVQALAHNPKSNLHPPNSNVFVSRLGI